MKKVTIVGAGNVGASCALQLAKRNICKIMLIDKMGDMATGKAIDLSQSIADKHINIDLEGGGDYSLMKDSEIVVITAGVPRKPGMTRDDLVKINKGILKDICGEIKINAPKAKVIIVSNPLDVLTNLAFKYLGGDPNKIVGMGGSLDGLRLISKVRKKINVCGSNISPMVIGEHGENMVIVPEYTTINGIPLTDLFKDDEIEQIIDETKKGGLEIVQFLKTGSAFYAPGEAVALMVESMLMDLKKIVCSCAHLNGEYGIKDLYIGVPALLGKNGVERIFELTLSPKVLREFEHAVESLKEKLS